MELAGGGDAAMGAVAPLVVLALVWLALDLASRRRRELGPVLTTVAAVWGGALAVAALLLSLSGTRWWPW